MGGEFTQYNGHLAPGLVRINADGTADGSFDPSKALLHASVMSLALQSDGRILVAGLLTNLDGSAWPGVIRLGPDGAVDASFYATPTMLEASYVSRYDSLQLAVQSDGKILLTGNCMRLNTDGSQDLRFVPDLRVPGNYPGTYVQAPVRFIAELSDHKVLVGTQLGEGVVRLRSGGLTSPG